MYEKYQEGYQKAQSFMLISPNLVKKFPPSSVQYVHMLLEIQVLILKKPHRVLRKWRMLAQVMAANFKPKKKDKNAMFIF
jgi:hypothetical protein